MLIAGTSAIFLLSFFKVVNVCKGMLGSKTENVVLLIIIFIFSIFDDDDDDNNNKNKNSSSNNNKTIQCSKG
jgi:hypothetical protein